VKTRGNLKAKVKNKAWNDYRGLALRRDQQMFRWSKYIYGPTVRRPIVLLLSHCLRRRRKKMFYLCLRAYASVFLSNYLLKKLRTYFGKMLYSPADSVA